MNPHNNTLQVVTLQHGTPSVSTLVMADGLAMPHATVMRTVTQYRDALEEFGPLNIDPLQLEGLKRGIQLVGPIHLNEQQCTLLMVYMPNTDKIKDFKKRVVNEFYRMRDVLVSSVKAIPQTYAEALRAAADASEQLAIAAPKAAAFDVIANHENTYSMRDAASTLDVKQSELIELLSVSLGWVYKRNNPVDTRLNNSWLAYAQPKDSGYLWSGEVEDANGKWWPQTRITSKGLTKLAEILASQKRIAA